MKGKKMKKKLLMMFCGALSAVASVNCNGAPADTDYGRGSNLGTNHFDIYPVLLRILPKNLQNLRSMS